VKSEDWTELDNGVMLLSCQRRDILFEEASLQTYIQWEILLGDTSWRYFFEILLRCTGLINTGHACILASRTRIRWLSPVAHGKDDACDAIAEPSGWLRVVL